MFQDGLILGPVRRKLAKIAGRSEKSSYTRKESFAIVITELLLI